MTRLRTGIAVCLILKALAAEGAALELVADGGNRRVMPCIEWAGYVQSMAHTGIERFLLMAREYIRQSSWPFLELAGHFIALNHLDGSNAAGAMAFSECRGIP